MRKFCCKHCGIISDNPIIVPQPTFDAYCREHDIYPRFNYVITCPVCENETRFWRENHYPTDKPSDEDSGVDLSTIPSHLI